MIKEQDDIYKYVALKALEEL